MIYKQFQGLQLSALGFGTMRLPMIGNSEEHIDEAAAAQMVEYAMRHGVNYYDTAWGYHGGQAEPVIGRILHEYPRESFYLASKFPGYDLKNMPRVAEIFERQLQRCQVEYFDFYLIHNVCELNIDAYLDPQYGIFDYLLEQKKNGRIRHLGFSNHGSMKTLKRFLDAYGDHMEFGQLQLNYIDYHFQQAEQAMAMLDERHIPVWVMEPLRGGQLCRIEEKHTGRLAALRPQVSAAEWGFRFLQSLPQVGVILSGMSDMTQLQDNIRIFAAERPLNETEQAALLDIAAEMTGTVLPCTSCRYCTSFCPQQLDIPWLLTLYNENKFSNGGFIAPMALAALPKNKRPSACIACRSCEAVCPQHIRISEALADFAARR